MGTSFKHGIGRLTKSFRSRNNKAAKATKNVLEGMDSVAFEDEDDINFEKTPTKPPMGPAGATLSVGVEMDAQPTLQTLSPGKGKKKENKFQYMYEADIHIS